MRRSGVRSSSAPPSPAACGTCQAIDADEYHHARRVPPPALASHNAARPAFAIVLACLAAANAHAFEVQPLRTTNQNPFIAIHDLPPDEGASLLPPGARRLELGLDFSNSFAADIAAHARLELDGETHRATLRYRRGLAGGWQFGVDLPWLSHSGGFLDGFILRWHDAFGLKQHGRDGVENDRLAFRYSREDAPRVDVNERQSGIGDLRLLAGYQLSEAADRFPFAVHASLALPTGDAEALLGSGGTDLALWLSAQGLFSAGRPVWSWYGSAGTLFTEAGDVLPERAKSLAAFGSVGAAWQPAGWIALQLQLNGHTALYEDAEVRHLETASLQLVMGGTLRLSPRTRLDLAVVEDAVIGTAPDVGFHLNLRRDF